LDDRLPDLSGFDIFISPSSSTLLIMFRFLKRWWILTLLAADYFAVGKTDAKFILGMKRIAER